MSGKIRNIVTFGASGRIDRKNEEYTNLHNHYEQLYSNMEKKRETANNTFEIVVEIKVKSLKALKKLSKISKNLQAKDREIVNDRLNEKFEKNNFRDIERTISIGESALNATKGVSTGISTALGAWALVSTVGTASTGTAIAGLSGAAATNATLAWFGGGAIAAGGGGMALGTMVIGGVFAIPALALTGVFSHLNANKKIKEIEEEIISLLKYIEIAENNILQLDILILRSEELCNSLDKANEVFEFEYRQVYKKIYPYGLISKLYKSFNKKILRKNYYSNSDMKEIAYIGRIAKEFAMIIDTKIIE